MKKLWVFILFMCITLVAQGAIYSYTAKDGKVYYTNEVPTGLTTAEKAKFKSVTTANWDKLTKAEQDKFKPVNDREAVKVVVKSDSAPTPTCDPDKLWNATTKVCENRCTAPNVWSNTKQICEVLPIPSTPSTSNAPPKISILCDEYAGTCSIPAGVTATVWRGTGGETGKWAAVTNKTGTVKCDDATVGNPNSGSYNRCFYLDNKLLEAVLDPKGQNLMPAVNTALVPKRTVNFTERMIKPAAIPPKDTNGGAFRISCEYSHMSNDDPIVFPGVPNATHHHTFFGNTGANAYSTSDTLHNSGDGTCAGGIINRSGYWMPSLINTTTGAPVKPSVIVVYYKTIDAKSGPYITAPPAGLRMIAGNAKPLSIADAQGGFYCQDQTQVMNPANWGIMWSGSSIKSSCGGVNQMLRMIVNFPQCWDGKNLDSPDHKSHMAFACGDECKNAAGVVAKSANSCPASHPIAIPNITLNVDYRELDANAKYRLASDNYSTAYPGGYSLHADWMNGWDEDILKRMVKGCINNPKNCGGPNLGDGETLWGVNQD